MTSWECYENKWFYMKYIAKYLLTREWVYVYENNDIQQMYGFHICNPMEHQIWAVVVIVLW